MSKIILFMALTLGLPLSVSAFTVTDYQKAEIFINQKNPTLRPEQTKVIINSVFKTAQKYKLNPKILFSILATESNFDAKAISNTGDYSIAQVNYRVWSKELYRIYNQRLSLTRLKRDVPYSIDVMGKILSHLQKQHSRKDINWFARYHSKTPKFKRVYAAKVNRNKRIQNNTRLVASNR